MSRKTEQAEPFQFFHWDESVDLVDAKIITMGECTPVQQDGMAKMYGPGAPRGDQTRVLFNIPGFSLLHVWFKKDYPLPLHSHDADCMYYIIAGSLQIGNKTLGPRDGFFIPSGVPYAYTPGPDGVELLEFRHNTHFDFQLHAKGEAFWKRALETMAANGAEWDKAKMPALNA